MSNEITEFVFIWLIENYSYLWHGNNEKLTSPMFVVDAFESTSWMLHLYPRGNRAVDEDYISFYLRRSEHCNVPERFSMNYELSFLASDGSTLCSYEFKEIDSSFLRCSTLGRHQFVMRNEILMKEKAAYLPQGTLTARCRMWKSQDLKHKIGQSWARTRIGIETISSLEMVENFSDLEMNQNVKCLIKSSSDESFLITLNLYLNNSSCCEGTIMMKITPSKTEKKILSSCSFLLIDATGRMIKCGQADGHSYKKIKDNWKVPLQFTKNILMGKKSEYLSNNTLSLLCEFTFSNGLEINRIEMTGYGIPLSSTPKPIPYNLNSTGACYIENKLSDSPTCVDDLKTMYRDQILSDVELKTKTNLFYAHKAVLCARSPVFRAMFTNDMKEKRVSCIELDDIEDDIVGRLLLFLYTDTLEDLQWETAIKLYYVADKYQVERLKLSCSSFLIDNIKASNASNILLLSDIHQDSDLKKVTTNFILKRHVEIFSSEEWQAFAKSNSQLALDTMLLIYATKEVKLG